MKNAKNGDDFTNSVVLFWADWCVPCNKMKEILEEMEEEMSSEVQFYIVNTDEETDLALKYGVRSLPTCFVLDKREDGTSFSEVKSRAEIESIITKII